LHTEYAAYLNFNCLEFGVKLQSGLLELCELLRDFHFQFRDCRAVHALGFLQCPCELILCIVLLLATSGLSDIPRWLGIEWDYGVNEVRWSHDALLFVVCMLCHGELYRRRPMDTRRLTEFYLCMSIGGALGGLFVTLVATQFFDDYLEWLMALVLVALLYAMQNPWSWREVRIDGRTEVVLDQVRNFLGHCIHSCADHFLCERQRYWRNFNVGHGPKTVAYGCVDWFGRWHLGQLCTPSRCL
jgi:hypothetical protein